MFQHETTVHKEISYTQAFSTRSAYTVIRRIMMFWSTNHTTVVPYDIIIIPLCCNCLQYSVNMLYRFVA